MRRLHLVLLVLVGAAAAAVLFRDHLGGSPDRGAHGLDLTIPPEYLVLQVDERGVEGAAMRAIAALEGDPSARIAVTFRDPVGRVEWLVDPGAGLIDERRIADSGTLRRVFWRGSVHDRLRSAAGSGTLEVDGLPRGESRNLYH